MVPFYEALRCLMNSACGSFTIRRKDWKDYYVVKDFSNGVYHLDMVHTLTNIHRTFLPMSTDLTTEDWIIERKD